MLNSFYGTYTAQPVVLPGKVFLESVFISRMKMISDNFKLSMLSNNNNNSSSSYSNNNDISSNGESILYDSQAAYPCIHQCMDGLLLQYLVRNRHWTYHRMSFDGLKSIVFQGPFVSYFK